MRAQAHTHAHTLYIMHVFECVCCWLCLLNCNKLIVIKHRLYILECVIGLFMLQFSPEDCRKRTRPPSPKISQVAL